MISILFVVESREISIFVRFAEENSFWMLQNLPRKVTRETLFVIDEFVIESRDHMKNPDLCAIFGRNSFLSATKLCES